MRKRPFTQHLPDAMVNFTARMDFLKTKGFREIEPMTAVH